MSNYLWTANGKFIKRNILEYFNVQEDKICIDETCISRDEMSQLKGLLPSFNILEKSRSLDVLTEYEVKLYLKEIFKKVFQAINDLEKEKIFNEYFTYGLTDPKSGDRLAFKNFYLDNIKKFIDFQDMYLSIETFSFYNFPLPEDYLKESLESGSVTATERTVFCFSLSDIQNIGPNVYGCAFKNYNIQLYKITTNSDSKWRIFLFTDNMLESMYIKQDEVFNEKFKKNLDVLNIYNQRNEVSLTEFREYVDNLRAVSLLKGVFNLEVFKNNLFVSYYKSSLDLKDLTDNDIMNKIYNPYSFDKIEIKALEDEKIYLGYYILHNFYISLEDSVDLDLRLIYGKKNSTDIYKWMLVYIKKN